MVWIGRSDGPATDTVECLLLPDVMRRAAMVAPRSFSLMLPGSTFARAQSEPETDALRRAHRVIVCPDTPSSRLADAFPVARLGVLPRPFDVETFA